MSESELKEHPVTSVSIRSAGEPGSSARLGRDAVSATAAPFSPGGHSHSGAGHSHSPGGHSHSGAGHSHSGAGHSHSGGGHGHGHGVATSAGFVAEEALPGTQRRPLARGSARGMVLFLDCQSGIAGDMTLAALIDLGVPPEVIEEVIGALDLGDVELRVRRGYAGAIGSTHVTVVASGPQEERSYGQIRALIERVPLEPEVRQLAQRIFLRLARAEAEVHRTSLEQVAFHEVGGVDAIVDIVGSAAALCYLGARVQASPLPLGRGHVACRHGVLPLPAPATLLCLRGVPTVPAELEVELVTPTGAAIIAEVAEAFVTWPRLILDRVGWGAGTRGLPDRPNVLRAALGTEQEPQAQPGTPDTSVFSHIELQANIDDMTGEVASYALSKLLSAGALDAWIVPVTMKKGRPGMVLCALAPAELADQVTAVFFSETSTIGVRKLAMMRSTLPRAMREVETRFGPVPCKVSGDPPSQFKPEIDACIAIAEREGLPLRVVLQEVERQFRGE